MEVINLLLCLFDRSIIVCISLIIKLKKHIQSNLVNWKSSGLEVLFQIISSLNYREVDIKLYNPKNDYYQFFYQK